MKETGSTKRYSSLVKAKVSGEDAILAGKKDADPEQEYLMDIPMIHEVNHFRRLKRSFVKEGHDGVINYLSKCGFSVDKEMIYSRL